MASVLSIDAAWTLHEPSGVALLDDSGGNWGCVAVAPSYTTFLNLADGKTVDWKSKKFAGTAPDPKKLVEAATRLLGGDPPSITTLDMPVAVIPFSERRTADNQISTSFGGRGCAAHSPNGVRPGALGMALTQGFAAAGYPVATSCSAPGTVSRLVEVYPHPALLRLLRADYRVPYKVSKSTKYWRELGMRERIGKLCCVFQQIQDALAQEISAIGLILPSLEQVPSLSHLKRYEDALDALVSAWVGIKYLARDVRVFGDHTAAIWVP
jgi:predicted RNase H-like nuclease